MNHININHMSNSYQINERLGKILRNKNLGKGKKYIILYSLIQSLFLRINLYH